MRIKNYGSKITGLFFGTAFVVSVFLGLTTSPGVLAAPYGCGTYGTDAYQNNCPAPSTPSTPAQSTPPADTSNAAEPTEVQAPEDDSVIVLNAYEDFFSDTGITVTKLVEGDVIAFCIETNTAGKCNESKDDYHKATIKKIDLSDPENPILTITFASTPFDVNFQKGETKKVDLDKDGTEDVEVTFVDMVDGHPIVTMKKINPLSASTTTPATTTADRSEPTQSQSNAWLWVIGIGAAVSALIAITVFFRHRSRARTVTW